MVVPVLMMSCQVSVKPKIGPVAAYTITIITAPMNVAGQPVRCVIFVEKRLKKRAAELTSFFGIETVLFAIMLSIQVS